MNSKHLPTLGDKSFEFIKQTNAHGAEYWSARDLQLLLGYSQWRRFEQAIKRAASSCQQSGNKPDYHFAGAGKPITGGKGAIQVVEDFHLSRFACYLIAQNGDPRIMLKSSVKAYQAKHRIASADFFDGRLIFGGNPPVLFASEGEIA